MAKLELEKLEQFPEEFAKFQTGLIRRIAGVSDAEKIYQIRNVIQSTYVEAVAQGLDLRSRPGNDVDWKERRHELDRAGTAQVQGLLTEEERKAFDRYFLGIMGVDLGTGVDTSLYPEGFLAMEFVDGPVGE